MNPPGKTNAELSAIRESLTTNPENRTGKIWPPFKPGIMRKLEAIDMAITANLAAKREASGYPVDTSGYTGRQTNRRR